MDWMIEWLPNQSVLRVDLKGDFNVDDFHRMVEEVCARGESSGFSSILFDDTKLDLSRASSLELMDVSDMFLVNNSSFAFRRIAILVGSSSDFELAGNFAKVTQPSSQAKWSVFMDEGEAIDWLASESNRPDRVQTQ